MIHADIQQAGQRPPVTAREAPGWHSIFVPVGGFLAVFGLFNFAELPFGWKNRTEQFARYLDATVGLGPDWVTPLLWTCKGLELTLGVIAVLAVLRHSVALLRAAVLGWIGAFTGFAAMDVWAADRAELQEHTVYFVMFTVLLAVVFVISTVTDGLRRLAQDRALDLRS